MRLSEAEEKLKRLGDEFEQNARELESELAEAGGEIEALEEQKEGMQAFRQKRKPSFSH